MFFCSVTCPHIFSARPAGQPARLPTMLQTTIFSSRRSTWIEFFNFVPQLVDETKHLNVSISFAKTFSHFVCFPQIYSNSFKKRSYVSNIAELSGKETNSANTLYLMKNENPLTLLLHITIAVLLLYYKSLFIFWGNLNNWVETSALDQKLLHQFRYSFLLYFWLVKIHLAAESQCFEFWRPKKRFFFGRQILKEISACCRNFCAGSEIWMVFLSYFGLIKINLSAKKVKLIYPKIFERYYSENKNNFFSWLLTLSQKSNGEHFQ